MKKVLIAGSLAYDNIMFFDGFFKSSIMPENLDNLSVSFFAHERKRFFGGCSGNIAYTMRLLGDDPYIFAVGGNDFGEYMEWLEKNAISSRYVSISEADPTGAAFILNDRGHSQITVFSPGAMFNDSFCMSFYTVDTSEIGLVLIAPDLPLRMLSVMRECVKYSIPFVFDPGQAMSSLSKEDLVEFMGNAAGLILNDYESKLLAERLDTSFDAIVGQLPFVVVTLGEEGARLFTGGQSVVIPTEPVQSPPDTTGCGDAFRSGFLHGTIRGLSLDESCRLGNRAASFAVKEVGTQNHYFSMVDFNSSTPS